jgi:hypothetical protein
MKKTFLLVIVVSIFCSFIPPIASNVFICKSKSSKRYHLTKTCRGLSACKAGVSEITLEKAKGLKRTLCKWED